MYFSSIYIRYAVETDLIYMNNLEAKTQHEQLANWECYASEIGLRWEENKFT